MQPRPILETDRPCAPKGTCSIGCYNRITKLAKSILLVSAILAGCSGNGRVGVLIVGCSSPKLPPVEDLIGHESLPQFKLQTLRGTRDGDRLRTQAMFSDSSSILTVEMTFAIGSPTKLQSGAWRWMRNNQLSSGMVAERSVTFLGGQDGPPSIGGTFDLLASDGIAHYRVTVPLTELKSRL